MSEISDLRSITGSQARAGILAALFGDNASRRSIADLAAAAGMSWSATQREVRRLAAAGVVRPTDASDMKTRRFEADPTFAGHLELRRFVLVTTGTVAAIRRSLLQLDRDQLAWVYGRYADGRYAGQRIAVAAITRERRPVSERLRSLGKELGLAVVADVMTFPEWVHRLEQREMRARAIRRATRLWLIGNEELLRQRERAEVSSRETWKAALKNWRDEEEWDEDYDEFMQPLKPVSRTG